MSTLIWKSGSPGYEEAKLSISVDELGIATISQDIHCKNESITALVLRTGIELCPLELFDLYIKGSSCKLAVAGAWTVSKQYSGLLSEERLTDPANRKYKCDSTISEEDISTHPRFRSFAGRLGHELNGAVFKADGTFDYFNDRLPNNTLNPKAGIEQFRSPRVVFTEERLARESQLNMFVRRLGKRRNPPDSNITPNRNWLVTEVSPEQVGGKVWKVTTTYSLSGPRGWFKTIYF
jgi:hypothetical protein